MDTNIIRTAIRTGRTALGIELGSTRIKAILLSEDRHVIASGHYTRENCLENGLWTYSLEDAILGLQQSYAMLKASVCDTYGIELTTIGSIGISGMMHGYLALDANGKPLAPFLTWRNTNTVRAADALTELFAFNIPLRWSISHLYQNILDCAPHLPEVRHLTTLAGYIHYLLTGEAVLGIGDAAGMFPIDSSRPDFDERMLAQFERQIADRNYPWKLREILPRVLTAGAHAGDLTPAGAKLLDPSGALRAGIPTVPPEGDAATGMTATNSVALGNGNVSAGTSIFAMIVLEKPLSKYYRDIDIVSTPSGRPVAMIHCNNGTSELDAWMRMFQELLQAFGTHASTDQLYCTLFQQSLAADHDGILLYNYISGEPITGLTDGRPLLVRSQDSRLTLSNFMRAQIYGIFASLSIGMRLLSEEHIPITRLTAHGGLFRTPEIAQRYLSAAMGVPVTVMQNAGEGGAYGMALLALYRLQGGARSLEEYLQAEVFSNTKSHTISADAAEQQSFHEYLRNYRNALPMEHCAVTCVAPAHIRD